MNMICNTKARCNQNVFIVTVFLLQDTGSPDVFETPDEKVGKVEGKAYQVERVFSVVSYIVNNY